MNPEIRLNANRGFAYFGWPVPIKSGFLDSNEVHATSDTRLRLIYTIWIKRSYGFVLTF